VISIGYNEPLCRAVDRYNACVAQFNAGSRKFLATKDVGAIRRFDTEQNIFRERRSLVRRM
jgi:hypothetical protein